MFYLSDEVCRVSIEEKKFHRNDPAEVDSYDFFCTDIQANSALFTFNLKNIEIYVFQLHELIEGVHDLIKGNNLEFEFSLHYDVMNIKFQRLDGGLSYCIYFTLRSISDGDFVLNGSINMTNDSIVELFNDIKYFMSAYE